nr:hypothetical protein [Endozoicomonas sp.]
ASWKRLKFNQHLMCRVFESLGLPLNDEKVLGTYAQLSGYGAIDYEGVNLKSSQNPTSAGWLIRIIIMMREPCFQYRVEYG